MAMVKSQKYSGVYYNQLENKDKVFFWIKNPFCICFIVWINSKRRLSRYIRIFMKQFQYGSNQHDEIKKRAKLIAQT